MTEDEVREVYNMIVESWKDMKNHAYLVGCKDDEKSEEGWGDWIDSVDERAKKYGNCQFIRLLNSIMMAEWERREIAIRERHQ